jgi:adenosyl cobinamide kinase/adenosyl cobinamide phosphate guanylyltransferase
MHRDRDFDLTPALPCNEHALTQDLELETLFRAMAGDDEFLYDIAQKVILSGLQNDEDTILYRQAILKDCLNNPAVVRGLYDLTVEAIEAEKRQWYGIFSRYPNAILHGSIELLQKFIGILRKLRGIAEEQAGRFNSEGFSTLFALLEKELSDEYLAGVRDHLNELKFPEGVLISADLGRGNEATNYVLRKLRRRKQTWFERLLRKGPPAFTFQIADRDEAGHRALSELRDRGIHLVANALAQSRDHILSFFQMLRAELAFYVGCLNLQGRLAAKGEPLCFPVPAPAGTRSHRFSGLYDACLALHMPQKVVGNTVDADHKSLVIITGANQGGKSSFLRSIGLAQMMMQAGMFVPAESFDAELCTALLTHYKREEDATMKRGKLDEELARMSEIVDHLGPNSMLLFNESFAATNEREGSEIARQVVQALIEKNIKVFFVTHLYEFARGFFDGNNEDALFLRPERRADGTRTFRLVKGEPLETSHGEDLYRKIFADQPKERREAPVSCG